MQLSDVSLILGRCIGVRKNHRRAIDVATIEVSEQFRKSMGKKSGNIDAIELHLKMISISNVN